MTARAPGELNTGQDRNLTWPVFSSMIEPNRGDV
jgi:hypothetical protein